MLLPGTSPGPVGRGTPPLSYYRQTPTVSNSTLLQERILATATTRKLTKLDLKHVLCQTQTVSNSVLLQGAHGVVVSHPLRTRKALGAIPSLSMLAESFHWSICSDMANPFEIFSPALARGHFVNLQQQRLSFLRQARPMSFACVQQKHLWSSGYDVSLTR